MGGYLSDLRVTNLWENAATEAPQQVAPNGPEEEIEDELDLLKTNVTRLLRQCTQL